MYRVSSTIQRWDEQTTGLIVLTRKIQIFVFFLVLFFTLNNVIYFQPFVAKPGMVHKYPSRKRCKLHAGKGLTYKEGNDSKIRRRKEWKGYPKTDLTSAKPSRSQLKDNGWGRSEKQTKEEEERDLIKEYLELRGVSLSHGKWASFKTKYDMRCEDVKMCEDKQTWGFCKRQSWRNDEKKKKNQDSPKCSPVTLSAGLFFV